jgi:hypothetical protein
MWFNYPFATGGSFIMALPAFVSISWSRRGNAGVAALILFSNLSACTDSLEIQSVPKPARTVVVRPASPGEDSTWDTFAADVVVRLERVDSAGNTVDASDPGIAFSLERTLQSTGAWRSIMTVRSSSSDIAPAPKGVLFEADRFDIGRIEDDGLGALPRVYNRRGDLLQAPSDKDIQALFPNSGQQKNDYSSSQTSTAPTSKRFERRWVESFVTPKSKAADRRAAIEAAFGASVGQLNGRDRYVKNNGSTLIEILVDRSRGLPVEMNEAYEGALRARTSLSYADAPDGLITLQAVRSERQESDTTRARSIVTVTYSNVRLERRS